MEKLATPADSDRFLLSIQGKISLWGKSFKAEAWYSGAGNSLPRQVLVPCRNPTDSLASVLWCRQHPLPAETKRSSLYTVKYPLLWDPGGEGHCSSFPPCPFGIARMSWCQLGSLLEDSDYVTATD